MGNALTLEIDHLKAAENAMLDVKEEAQAYTNRIAALEAQLNKVSMVLSERAALRKERAGSKLMPGIDTLMLKENTSASNSSNRPRADHQRSDFEAYTQAEGGTFTLKNKPPSFGNIYSADNSELDTKLIHGYNPIYEGKKQDRSAQGLVHASSSHVRVAIDQ